MKVSARVKEIMGQVSFDGGLCSAITLPELDRKDYLATMEVLEAFGAKWDRRAKAILFPDGQDAFKAVQSIMWDDEILHATKDLEFFETPAELAKKMVLHARLKPGLSVLEPSAGRGAILKESAKTCATACIELNPAFVQELDNLGLARSVYHGDFLKCGDAPEENRFAAQYDRVIMNPPFSKGQDVAHVTHAYTNFLKPGGILVAIMGQGVMFRQDRKYTEFRDMVDNAGGVFHQLPEGTFKSSGTGCNTVMLVIQKPKAKTGGIVPHTTEPTQKEVLTMPEDDISLDAPAFDIPTPQETPQTPEETPEAIQADAEPESQVSPEDSENWEYAQTDKGNEDQTGENVGEESQVPPVKASKPKATKKPAKETPVGMPIPGVEVPAPTEEKPQSKRAKKDGNHTAGTEPTPAKIELPKDLPLPEAMPLGKDEKTANTKAINAVESTVALTRTAAGSAIATLASRTADAVTAMGLRVATMGAEELIDTYKATAKLERATWTVRTCLAAGLKNVCDVAAKNQKAELSARGITDFKNESLVSKKVREIADLVGVSQSVIYAEAAIYNTILGYDYEAKPVYDPYTGTQVTAEDVANMTEQFSQTFFAIAKDFFANPEVGIHPSAALAVLLDMKLSTHPNMTKREASDYLRAIKGKVDPRDGEALAKFLGQVEEEKPAPVPATPKPVRSEGAKTTEPEAFPDNASDATDYVNAVSGAVRKVSGSDALAYVLYVYRDAGNRYTFGDTPQETCEAGEVVTSITKAEGEISVGFVTIQKAG